MNSPPSVPHARAHGKRKKDGKRDTETNGFFITLMSNRQTPDRKKERKKMEKTDIIISKRISIECSDDDENILLVGGAGTGASSYVAANILQACGTYIISDPEGALYRQYGEFLESMGYKTRRLDLIRFTGGNRYNPFKYIRDDRDIEKIADIMIRKTACPGNNIREKQIMFLMEALIAYVRYHMPESERNFSNVVRLLQKCDISGSDMPSDLDKAFEEAGKTVPGSFAVNRYGCFKAGCGGDKGVEKSVLISCAVLLQIFMLSDTGAMTDTDDIDLDSLWEEKTALFIITPATENTFNVLAIMLYSQLFDIIGRYCKWEPGLNESAVRPLPVYTKVFLNAHTGLPDLDGILLKDGARRLSVSVAVQNSEHMAKVCGEKWKKISERFMTIVFLSDGQSVRRAFAAFAYNDGARFFYNNGGTGPAKSYICWIYELFRNMTEKECIVVRRPGQVYKDYRHDMSILNCGSGKKRGTDTAADNVQGKSGKYIGISENRLHHILGVARRAYAIAKERGHNEEFARKMFMAGWLHDVGYEFSEKQDQHPYESARLIRLAVEDGWHEPAHVLSSVEKAVKEHGRYTEKVTEEYVILNMADMLTDPKGNEVSVMQRLDDIKERYGEYSDQYLTACDICFRIGLTACNIAPEG